MSAQLRPKCPQCGSYYLSTLEGEKKRKCIDCKLEFKTDDKQVVVNNRIKNN
jgi:transposase-like protein